MAFKLISATYDCATDLIHIKFTGDDSGIVLNLLCYNCGAQNVVADRISKGIYKSRKVLQKGLYLVNAVYQNPYSRGDDFVILKQQCGCTIVPQKIPFPNIIVTPFSQGFTFSYTGLAKYGIGNIFLYKSFIGNKLDQFLNPFAIQNFFGSLLQKTIPQNGIIEGFLTNDECGDDRVTVYILSPDGCLLYYTDENFKPFPDTVNFKLSYTKGKGIDYSYNGCKDVLFTPSLPPRGTILKPGKYCYTIYSPSLCSRCYTRCITVPEDPNVYKPPLGSGCNLKMDTDIVIEEIGADCSARVTNKSKVTITLTILKAKSYVDGCAYVEDWYVFYSKVLKPGEEIRFGIGFDKFWMKAIVEYLDGDRQCKLEKCIRYCLK